MSAERWLSVEEVSNKLAMVPRQVRKLIAMGELPVSDGGLVSLADYDAMIVRGVARQQARVRPAGPPAPRQGVYFVLLQAFIKIGISQDVLVRWRSVTDLPFTVEPLGFIRHESSIECREHEERLHVEFNAYRHRGEWFRDNAALRAYIAEHASPWPTR